MPVLRAENARSELLTFADVAAFVQSTSMSKLSAVRDRLRSDRLRTDAATGWGEARTQYQGGAAGGAAGEGCVGMLGGAWAGMVLGGETSLQAASLCAQARTQYQSGFGGFGGPEYQSTGGAGDGGAMLYAAAQMLEPDRPDERLSDIAPICDDGEGEVACMVRYDDELEEAEVRPPTTPRLQPPARQPRVHAVCSLG